MAGLSDGRIFLFCPVTLNSASFNSRANRFSDLFALG